ncbi:MAG TPA: VWA domain-containing protein [Burkholderiales bacterium]|nr:VWA domain-containing protein [Burkholderiales bacterium]
MIQFAYPLALLSLLSIPLILALYLLRPKRRRVILPTTTLWQKALKDRERGLGLRRLLRDASLLLLLATALALGAGLAGPQWSTRAGEHADTVLVLDVSASMKTRAGIRTTRFDQALAEAARIVDGLPGGGRMLVMTSGRKAVLRTGFETDRDALRRTLTQLRPGDEAGRPREALALALSLLRSREGGRIHFITDGAFDPEVDPGSAQVAFRIVGDRAKNVAVTRFDMRQEPGSDERFQALLTLSNYTDAPVVVPASVTLEGRVLFSDAVEVKARAEETLILPFRGRAIGRARARIDVNDDLAADNQAYAVVNADHSLRVLLFSSGNFYLESVLEALPGVAVVKREWSPDQNLAQLARAHDVVVFDGIDAPPLPPGKFVLVNSVAPGLPFSHAGWVARPAILGRGASALMRDVDLTAVRIDQARHVVIEQPVPGLQRLFWSSETELALALLDDEVKLIYVGFDLYRSNFPLQAAFPLFVSQSLEWLRPRGEAFQANHIPAGSTHTIRVPSGETRVIVETPSGTTETLQTEGDSVSFDTTSDAGIYQYTIGDGARYFAITLTDARESDVNARWMPREQREEVRPADSQAQAVMPLWPELLVLALVLLGLEWFAWIGSRGSA